MKEKIGLTNLQCVVSYITSKINILLRGPSGRIRWGKRKSKKTKIKLIN